MFLSFILDCIRIAGFTSVVVWVCWSMYQVTSSASVNANMLTLQRQYCSFCWTLCFTLPHMKSTVHMMYMLVLGWRQNIFSLFTAVHKKTALEHGCNLTTNRLSTSSSSSFSLSAMCSPCHFFTWVFSSFLQAYIIPVARTWEAQTCRLKWKCDEEIYVVEKQIFRN